MSESNDPGAPLPFLRYYGGEINVEEARLIQFLEDHGFAKYYGPREHTSSLVRVEDHIVHRTSTERIKEFVIEQVENIPEDEVPDTCTRLDLKDALIRGSNVYFSKKRLEFLPEIDAEFKRDTSDEAFFYYKNGFVRVTEGGYNLKNYSEMDGVVWNNEIINRHFPRRHFYSVEDSDWIDLLWNVAGKSRQRLDALASALGYLLHGYKDPTVAKAIIFVDEKISDVPSGRTGKSLIAKSLKKLVSVQWEDARNFAFNSQFSFQSINREDQIFALNDAPRSFDFGKLFSLITDDMQVERKFEDKITIPFEDSPKIVITTNYMIEGEGPSFEDRVFQIEFAPHYGPDFTPEDEFGHRVFDDWSRREWKDFDTLMMTFVRDYLRDGLQGYEHVNLKRRKLRQETSPEFAGWILNKESGEYQKSDLFGEFKAEMDDEYDFPGSQRKFTRWCNTFGRIYTGEELPTRKSGSDRYITLPDL